MTKKPTRARNQEKTGPVITKCVVDSEKKWADSTIFDDVFMTLCERMPELLIPLINEAFGTDYSEDEKIIKLRDEHHLQRNKIITDAYVGIRDLTYHIECQSNDDDVMVIRMFEYDTVIAIESRKLIDGVIEIDYPRSCVVYLKGKDVDKHRVILRVRFPDGFVYDYKPKVLEVESYELDELFKKHLLMLLPFYLIRYEKIIKRDDTEDPEFQILIQETGSLTERLTELRGENRNELYVNLAGYIKRIIEYLCRRSENVRERMAKSMGGKILELPSDILKAEGRREGETIGETKGETKALAGLVQDGIIDAKTAAKRMGVSVKKFKEMAAAQSFIL
ncbi:MAG: hypothetical protein IJL07_00855 [Lachnospiraceae bacterium]|nr:hypothetical protein [Lachnospiraceae bacterium]